MLSFTPAHASVQEIRVVGVAVNSSSMTAEAQALDYARKRAVYLAARKIGVKNPEKLVAKFTDTQFDQIIRGANVVQQRRQDDITYLEVNVTVVEEALLRALKLPDDYGKPPAPEVKVRGILLLPVYVGKERAYLWEKENVLRPLVSDEIRRQAHGGVLLPGGDFDDLRLVDYQNALTVKPEELKPMFDRYGAEEIIVAVLTLGPAGTTDSSSVLLRRLKRASARNEVLDIAPESADEATDVRLQKSATAIAAAITQIATSTAEHDLAMRQAAKKIKVRFSYTIPRDLARMQEAVRASPEVLYLDLPSIALARVTGTIYLKGDDEALRNALTKQGIIVTSINDGWRLSVR